MRLIGIASTYREGSLARECVRSLLRANCDKVLVFEGPFGDAPLTGDPSELSHRDIREAIKRQELFVREGKWVNQAAKLNEILSFCRRYERDGEPVWTLHVDGDEVLLWPEMLRDLVERFTEAGPGEFRMRLKLVELDGTCGYTGSHLLRFDLIDRYLVSGTQLQLRNGMVVAVDNPDGDRFPIQGEPHLLHRSVMRRAGRDAPALRAHMSEEAEWFETAAAGAGLDRVTQQARTELLGDLCGMCRARPAERHGLCMGCYIASPTPEFSR